MFNCVLQKTDVSNKEIPETSKMLKASSRAV